MIALPDFDKSFEYENNFYLSSDVSRLNKPIVHYELYKKTINIPGTFAELGLFKGNSFLRFLAFRNMLESAGARKFIGFDTFGTFPEAKLENDKVMLENYLNNAGDQSISKSQLEKVLNYKGLNQNVELICGDINKTVPEFIKQNQGIKFSMIHLDVDLYEPSITCLKYMYPLLSEGGILVLDDYAVWEGETKAVDDYFADKPVEILRFPFSAAPSYIVKRT